MVNVSRAHGFVPSRGFPLAFSRTALSRLFGHRFGPVQASPTICASELFACFPKLAVICGARSALRQWSCSNCECRCERIHYLIFKFRAKSRLHLRHFKVDETAQTDISDQRGRKDTAEPTQTAPNELKLDEGG